MHSAQYDGLACCVHVLHIPLQRHDKTGFGSELVCCQLHTEPMQFPGCCSPLCNYIVITGGTCSRALNLSNMTSKLESVRMIVVNTQSHFDNAGLCMDLDYIIYFQSVLLVFRDKDIYVLQLIVLPNVFNAANYAVLRETFIFQKVTLLRFLHIFINQPELQSLYQFAIS